jgi:regulator of protease activity HflC (stomatin/prohibitin superfamily)
VHGYETAEREAGAKVIAAEGEFQAAQRLADAAEIMSKSPITLQLRYLQTLKEIAAEHNSTPVLQPLRKKHRARVQPNLAAAARGVRFRLV